MSLICLTTHDLVNTFLNMSIDTIEFDNYTQINKSCDILIVDENGFVEQNLLRYLIELSCKIFYICDLENLDITRYLVSNNQYNIYTGVEITDLTASKILEIVKTTKTKEDISSNIKDTGKVFSISSTIEALTAFIDAIDSKDVEMISKIFNEHFDSFKSVKSVIEGNMLEVDSSRTQVKNLSRELDDKQKELEELTYKFDKLVDCGKQCEDENRSLSEELVTCKNYITEVESKLSSADVRLDELLLSLQNKDAELGESRELVDTLKLNLNNAQSRNKQLVKDNDILKESLNSMRCIPEDNEVSITSMGSVGKIMYVKMIDPLPYLISAFKYYQKYNGGANKNPTGLVLVTSKGSTISSSYINSDGSNLISSNTNYVDCNKNLYVMEGYSLNIRKYIENCGCNCVIILDYTFSETIFLKSINQVELYGVNNKKSYADWNIAPSKCISQARVENVPCRLPFVENYESLGPVDKINIYKENVFTYLDKCWW